MKGKRFVTKSVLQPAIRMTVLSMIAVGWYLIANFLFLDFFPLNFNAYNTMVKNSGSTTYDVYFVWAWIPTIFIFVVGIFWASGLLGELWEVLKRL